MGLLNSYHWARLRYTNPAKAVDALNRLARNGAKLDLRLRANQSDALEGDTEHVLALFVGAEERWLKVLEHMSRDFELHLETAKEPKALAHAFAPGHWAEQRLEADAKVSASGMHVGLGSKERDRSKDAGAPIELPALSLGLTATPELPYPVQMPNDAVWTVGEGGLVAPAGLLGDPEAQMAFLLPLSAIALKSDYPTLIVDGGGDLSSRLRQKSEIAPSIAQGRLREMSLARAGQLGFNPLAESAWGEAATLRRWHWWFRGVGVHEPTFIEGAYQAGVRSFADAYSFWSQEARMLPAAHAANRMVGDGVVSAWLSGDFDFSSHFGYGGHVLVECPDPSGPRLQALRGLLALVMEAALTAGAVRVLSVGVEWTENDWRVLDNLQVLHAGKGGRWSSMVFTRCSEEVAAKVVGHFGESRIAEFLRTLPDGVALARRKGGDWWSLKAI